MVLGGAPDPLAATGRLLGGFGDGPVVVGPAVPTLDEATESARAALAGFRAAPAWPAAPRPVAAADLLPERALAGDSEARRGCGRTSTAPLVRAGGELLETLDAFFAAGGVLESAARALFVHPNTVRYRLRRIGEVTGFSPLHPAGRVRAADGADHRPAGPGGARPTDHPDIERSFSHKSAHNRAPSPPIFVGTLQRVVVWFGGLRQRT